MKIHFLTLFFLFININSACSQADQKKTAQVVLKIEDEPAISIQVSPYKDLLDESQDEIEQKLISGISELKKEGLPERIYSILENLRFYREVYEKKSPLKKEIAKQIEDNRKESLDLLHSDLKMRITEMNDYIAELEKSLEQKKKGLVSTYKDFFKKVFIIISSEMFQDLYHSHADKAQKESLQKHIGMILLSLSRFLIKLEQQIRKKNFDRFTLYMEISRDYDYLQNFAHSLGMYKTKTDNTKKRKELYDLRQREQ